MFELTLDNDESSAEKVSFDDVNQIHDWEDLSDLFNGAKYLNIDTEEIVDYETYGTTPRDEATIKPIKAAKWAFAGDSSWKSYVQAEMNDLGIEGVQGLLEGGIESGYTELMWTDKCYAVLAEHIREIEGVISDIVAGGMGFDFWGIFNDGFDLQKLTWCAFEESVRNIIECDVGLCL